MAITVLNVFVTNVDSNLVTHRIPGTTFNLAPGTTVDLLTQLTLQQVNDLYGLQDMIAAKLVRATVVRSDGVSENLTPLAADSQLLSINSSVSGGTAGPQGVSGTQGIQGIQGIQGVSGTQGIQGPAGQDASTFALVNDFWVDSVSGSDSLGTGAIGKPWKTLGKVAVVIGAAASNAEFNDATKTFYRIHGKGVFSESPVFGTRPHIVLDMTDGVLVGDLTVQFNQGAIFGSGHQQPKFSILGSDLRNDYNASDQIKISVDGNIFVESIGSGSSLFQQLHLIDAGCTGDVHQRLGSGGGVFTLSLFIDKAIVSGSIRADSSAGSTSLYAYDIDTSGSQTIGGVSGTVLLNVLNNVRFDGPVITSSGGGRWRHVAFVAGNNFTGSSGTITADEDSMIAFFKNTVNKGTTNFAAFDVYSGATSARPTPGSGSLLAGFRYFDTTLNKPIWAKGDGTWVDASGLSV